MKKLLALVLALVMTLGLATVGANAAYKDADSINYTEAVDVMSAIGVLAGDETGFRPADTLKRSEGAKIIAYLMVGEKTAEAIQPTGTKYTDLPANHWAAGYMEYLSAVGVMGGIGDGKIDPDGQLTATAFAKMLLTALGYDAQIEGFGGSDWSINVQKIANKVGIFDGNRSVVGSNAVTREEAALYAFNTIQAPLVEYANKGNTLTLNDAKIEFGASNATYKTSTISKDQTISEDFINNGSATKTYITEFAEEYYPDLKLVGLGTGTNDFGQPIHKWTNANVEVGTYVLTEGLVKSWTGKVERKAVYETLGKDRYDAVKNGSSGIEYYVDGRYVGAVQGNATLYAGDSVDNYMNRSDSSSIGIDKNTGNGTVTELYVNEDNDIRLVSYNTYVFQAVGDYSAAKQSVNITPAGDTSNFITLNDRTLKLEDFSKIEDFKSDDYILVTATDTDMDNRYDAQTAEKATLVTGTVEAFQNDGTYSVTLDGTKYNYSLKTSTSGTSEPVKTTLYTVGQKATLVLDKADNVIAVDSALVLSDYVFITKFGDGTSNLNSNAYANAIFTDGTEATIKVRSAYDYGTSKQITSQSGIVALNTVNSWYTFSKNSSNEYALYKAEAKYTAAQEIYAGSAGSDVAVTDDNKVNFIYNGTGATDMTTLAANDKTTFIVKDETNDVITVYTGVKNMPEITLDKDVTANATISLLYNTTGKFVSVAFASVTKGTISGASGLQLVYVTEYKGVNYTEGNETAYRYETLDLKGEKTEQIADTKLVDGNGDDWGKPYQAVNYVSKKYDTKAQADLLTGFKTAVATGSNGIVATGKQTGKTISYNNGVLTLGDAGSYITNENTKILLVLKAGNGLKADDGKTYETIADYSAEQVANYLKGYTMTFNAEGKLTDTTSQTLSELYITISNAGKAETVTGDYYVTNNETVAADDALAITGDLVVASGATLTVYGNVNFDGDLDIYGTVYVAKGGTFTQSGANVSSPNVIYGQSLRVADGASATLNNEYGTEVYGLVNIAEAMNITGDLTVVSDTTYTGTLVISDNVKVTGDLIINDGASTTISSGAKLTVTGDAQIDETVTASANAIAVDGVVYTDTSDATLAANVKKVTGETATDESATNNVDTTGLSVKIEGNGTAKVYFTTAETPSAAAAVAAVEKYLTSNGYTFTTPSYTSSTNTYVWQDVKKDGYLTTDFNGGNDLTFIPSGTTVLRGIVTYQGAMTAAGAEPASSSLTQTAVTNTSGLYTVSGSGASTTYVLNVTSGYVSLNGEWYDTTSGASSKAVAVKAGDVLLTANTKVTFDTADYYFTKDGDNAITTPAAAVGTSGTGWRRATGVTPTYSYVAYDATLDTNDNLADGDVFETGYCTVSGVSNEKVYVDGSSDLDYFKAGTAIGIYNSAAHTASTKYQVSITDAEGNVTKLDPIAAVSEDSKVKIKLSAAQTTGDITAIDEVFTVALANEVVFKSADTGTTFAAISWTLNGEAVTESEIDVTDADEIVAEITINKLAAYNNDAATLSAVTNAADDDVGSDPDLDAAAEFVGAGSVITDNSDGTADLAAAGFDTAKKVSVQFSAVDAAGLTLGILYTLGTNQ